MIKKSTSGSNPKLPVMAVYPITGGSAPEIPPISVAKGLFLFRVRV